MLLVHSSVRSSVTDYSILLGSSFLRVKRKPMGPSDA